MDNYRGAHYQRDVYNELSHQHDVYIYGPGNQGFDVEDDLNMVVKKSNFGKPDLICVGHSWLNDNVDMPLTVQSKIDLIDSPYPTVMIINKEYVRLDEKLDFIKENGIKLVFSHIHTINEIAKIEGTKFIFWPFAVKHKNFYDQKLNKTFDLTFTGMLINGEHQMDDFRLRIQRKLFYTCGELRFFKKPRYRKFRIYWNGQPSTAKLKKIQKSISAYKWLNTEEYSQLLNRSRACLNTLSTMDIISPRYFESMACKCIVLCQESEQYGNLFTDNVNCLMVRNDLSNFDEQLSKCMDNQQSQRIADNAYKYVMENHTWEIRIKEFISECMSFYNIQ